jgi:tRNA(Ile)-lysidine synthase
MERFGIASTGVAVSGGADSVFLLHALHELGRATAVLHVNHGLRGAESNADEAFVRDLAAHYNLPFRLTAAPVPPGNTEQEARRLRYEFFKAYGMVATGHTLDDQAETVLYRFLRGSGTAGLSGIRPAAPGIIRPLLELRREEIRTWLREHEIPWREDSSNANPDFARNRIRLNHMRELSASLNPSLAEGLASTAEWARGEEDYWSAELDRLEPLYLDIRSETVLIQLGSFCLLPLAVQRRLLRRAIERVRGSLRSIDFRHVEGIRAMMATAEGSGRAQLPGLEAYRSFDWLRLGPPGFDARIERDFEMPVLIPGRTEDIDRCIALDVELCPGGHVYNDGVSRLDGERCAGSLMLRNWRPGDQTAGKKIKTLFQEHRIPLWERRTWPVVTSGNSIVWTRRFGAASEFAAGPESRKILMIREVKESNPVNPASMELKRVRHSSPESGAEVL